MYRKTMIALLLVAQPVVAADETCELTMTDAEIREIVRDARKTRTDLFQPYKVQEVRVTKDYRACHYAYVEWALPAKPGRNHVIYVAVDGRIKGKMAGH